jgi:hypothetical protein
MEHQASPNDAQAKGLDAGTLDEIEDPRSDRDDGAMATEPPEVAGRRFLANLQSAFSGMETGSVLVLQHISPDVPIQSVPDDVKIQPIPRDVWHGMLESIRTDDATRDKPVDERQVLLLVSGVKDALAKAGTEAIMPTVKDVLADPSAVERLRDILSRPSPAEEVTERIVSQIPDAHKRQSTVRTLVIAGTLLLAAGAAIPLVAGAAAETILTNEIATAALVAATAALLKK